MRTLLAFFLLASIAGCPRIQGGGLAPATPMHSHADVTADCWPPAR